MFDIEAYIKQFAEFPKPRASAFWAEEFDAMAVHSRKAAPKKLIETRRPNEDDKIHKYRLDSYEPITMTVINRGIERLQSVFNESNVTFDIPQDLKNYVNDTVFKGLNFHSYVNNFVLKRMIEDANGILTFWPRGAGVTEANQEVEVDPILLLSKNIVHLYPEHKPEVLTFLSSEKSVVQVKRNNKYVDSSVGKVYYIITKDAYYRYIQYGKQTDNKFILELWYQHDMGEIPIIKLGGLETSKIEVSKKPLKAHREEIPYLTSFFAAFVPYANESIRQFSDHQAVMVTSGHPIKEIEMMPCTNRECRNGRIWEFDENNNKKGYHLCPDCDGNGRIAPVSPYGWLQKPKGDALNNDSKTPDAPAMRYINPDVEVLKYSGEHWRELLNEAEKAINLVFVDQAQSGEAKKVDRESLISMLDKIGKNVYENIYKRSLKFIDALRFMNRDSQIDISLPASFRVKTEVELMNELVKLRNEGAPDFVVAQAAKDFVRKRYAGNKLLQKQCEVLIRYDVLFPYTPKQKQEMLASRGVDQSLYIKSIHSTNAIILVTDSYGEDTNEFMEAEYEDIVKRLDEIIQPYIDAQTPTPIVNPDGTA